MKVFDWNGNSEKQLHEYATVQPIFVAGSREISPTRIAKIFKKYIYKGNILWGVHKEKYIEGFEGQSQFKSLAKEHLVAVLKKLEMYKERLPHNWNVIEYRQQDLKEVLQTVPVSRILFINGSWKIVFQRRPEYAVIKRKSIPYKLISPFHSEDEALAYAKNISQRIKEKVPVETNLMYSTDSDLLNLAGIVSQYSFDNTWQTGAVIARHGKVLVYGWNRILPFETYAMHNGSQREKKHYLAMNDLNNQDTVHAEIDCITQALNKGIDLEHSTLYIPLLPCPTCAKAIARTGIQRIVYSLDHYGGYAKSFLEQCGKRVDKLQ
ncbi:MAG: deoxycytidylate deaminase [Candidatus Dojkabacteria bacterium]